MWCGVMAVRMDGWVACVSTERKGHRATYANPCPRHKSATRSQTRLLVVVVDDGLGVLVERLEAIPQCRRLVVRAVDQRLACQLCVRWVQGWMAVVFCVTM